MPGGISSLRLERDLQTSLKLWHNAKADASPLDYLYLFQQVRRNSASHPRQATNQVILQALEKLEADYPQEAKLLRLRFLEGTKVHILANQLNLAEPTIYKLQRHAIRCLSTTLHVLEHQARQDYQIILEKKLNLPPDVQLIGVEEHLRQLPEVLLTPEAPWIISLEGLGGIGKTALANRLVRQPELASHYTNIAWISVKQQEFLPGVGLKEIDRPALSPDALIDELIEQLDETISLTQSSREKTIALTKLLKETPYLIVIDNLETVSDYQTLLPTLQQFASPSKFLLTSRHSLQAYSDVYCSSLQELSRTDTIYFIKYEAQIRGLATLANAAEEQLEHIYQVVGGNPLALKLVIGQISVLPLSHVLENLKQAYGQTADELYTYIYWQAWKMLETISQQVLLIMPLAQDNTLDELLALSELEIHSLSQALQQLVSLSLVEVGGNLEERRYRIHHLTETFLLKEALKWQSSI